MSDRDGGDPGIKLLTIGIVGMLLSFGLCGIGQHFDNKAGLVIGTAGQYLFLASLVGIGAGMILFLFPRRR